MPIHVDIRINEQVINTIHIGRMSGGTKPNDLNTYVVVEGNRPETINDWYDTGEELVHRYGDGAEVLVMLALKKLGYEPSNKIGTNPPPRKDTTWDGSGWDYRSSKS